MNAALVRGLVLRWILRHRVRSALGVLAVALGVAAYVASVAVAGSVVATAASTTAAFAGGADLVVQADEAGLSASCVAAVRGADGVAAAAPLVSGWVRIGDGSGRRALLVGVDPSAEAAMQRGGAGARDRFEIRDPASFVLGRAAILSRPLADGARIADGGTITIQGARGAVRLGVAGIVDPPGGTRSPAARTIVVPSALARSILGRGDRVDRIDVALAPGADAAATSASILARLGAAVPPTTRVTSPGERDPATADLLGVVDVSLRLGALVSLLVGVFLVHHTIAVGVTERTREVGIFRALGATRRQVVAVFCVEALALGLVGSAAGVGLGALLARTSLDAFAATISGAYFASDPAPIEMTVSLAATGIVAGAVVALFAAWRPARRAASVAPNDAIRRGPEEASQPRGAVRGRVAAAIAFAVASGACVTVTFPRAGWYAAFLLLLAFLVVAPLILSAGAKALAPLLSRLGGVPGRLAAEELARHPGRAALPAATLAIGLALVVETMGNTRSLGDSMSDWIEENVAGDLFVSSGRSALTSAGHTLLDAGLATDLAEIEGIETVTGVRTLRVPWGGTRVLLLGLDIASYRRMARVTVHGEGGRDAILARLETGSACIVSENFSTLHGVRLGDDVEIPATDGVVTLRVAGLFPDYSWPRGTILLDRGVLERRLGDRLVDEFSLRLAPDADAAAVEQRIEAKIGAGRELVLLSAAELRAAAHQLLDDFFALSNAQVLAALAVAFLGVFNSLWIAVVMRRRELGLFRAVGATRGQLVRSIELQAATMGAIGAVLGVVGGLAVQWIALRRVIVEDTGWTPAVVVAWVPVAAVVVLGVVTSAAAGLLPARSAARTEIRDAIGYE